MDVATEWEARKALLRGAVPSPSISPETSPEAWNDTAVNLAARAPGHDES
jgi:hypothetical protein